MEVYNESKNQILSDYDLNKGYLEADILKCELPQVDEVKSQGHYETIKVYENGGRDVKWVVDVEGVSFKPARVEFKDILVYVPFSPEQQRAFDLKRLRAIREEECFSIINRGQLWYNGLNSLQLSELQLWYKKWLNITEKYVDGISFDLLIPEKPSWIK